MRFRPLLLSLVIVFGVALPTAWAQDELPKTDAPKEAPQETPPKWDEFPPIELYQRVGIKARYDGPRYNDMRKCMRRFKSKVKARYYAGMVDVTDREGRANRKHNDAQAYAAAMYEAWKEPAKLKPERTIILVMGLRNRSVGVYAGPRFQKLGLTDQAIQDAIAGSQYKQWMKSYDLNQAMCAVATGIDFKLYDLQLAMERRIEAAKAEMPNVEADLAKAQVALSKVFKEKNTFGDALKAKMAATAKTVEDAKSKLETDPVEAVTLFDKARSELAEVAAERERYEVAMEALAKVEVELDALKKEVEGRPDSDWEFPAAARKKLDECEEKAEAIRDTLENDASQVQECLLAARGDLARGDVHHHYQADLIPTMIASTVAVLVLLIVLGLFLRRRRILRVLDPDLREWDAVLSWAAVRLSRVASEYQSYLNEREIWQGEAADLDRATISKLSRAFLLQASGQQLLQRAKELRSSSKGLGVMKLERAAYLLRESAVEFSSDARDPRCPIHITQDLYDSKSSELRGDLAMSLAEAIALLAQVDVYMKKIDEDTTIATAAAHAAQAAVEGRRGLKLPTTELESVLEVRLGELAHGKALVAVDPVQAAEVLEASADHLVALQKRAEVGNEVVRELRQSVVGLGAKLRKVAHKLSSSGPVDEPGFTPVASLDEGSSRVDEILTKVNQGDELAALALKDVLVTDMAELRRLLAIRAESPKLLPLMAGFLAPQREELNGYILKIRMAIQKATPDIQKGYTPFLDKLTEFQRVLSKVNRSQGRIDAEIADRHYLAAASILADLMGPYQEGVATVAQLVEAIGVPIERPLDMPEAWRKSVLKSWDGGEFLPKGTMGSSKRW